MSEPVVLRDVVAGFEVDVYRRECRMRRGGEDRQWPASYLETAAVAYHLAGEVSRLTAELAAANEHAQRATAELSRACEDILKERSRAERAEQQRDEATARYFALANPCACLWACLAADDTIGQQAQADLLLMRDQLPEPGEWPAGNATPDEEVR